MVLEGAIDLHVHSAPDVYPRSLDDLEVVRAAEAAGMRAILLKSHHTLTADRASMVEKQVGIAVRGGLALNLTVGGLNPVAVETAIAFGARQIWMPTIHSRHCLQLARTEDDTAAMFQAEANKGYPGLALLDDDGNPVAGLLEILELVRDADLILGTGHLAPDESLALLQIARGMNIERMLVTHPLMSFTMFSREQMQRAVALGAYLEFDALSCHPRWPKSMPPDATARAIEAVGARHCVVASDGGQASNAAAPQMLLDFAVSLSQAGITDDDLRLMMCVTPAWLLGL